MKTIFLDRDGVINKDAGYVGKWADFHFLPGVVDALRILMEKRFQIIIVTNQSGIARGYYTESEYLDLEKMIEDHLSQLGITITATYYCPHYPSGLVPEYSIECQCRKPKTGMLTRAAEEHSIDFSKSIMIGDKKSDMQAAQSVGIQNAYLIQSVQKEGLFNPGARNAIFKSLLECIKIL